MDFPIPPPGYTARWGGKLFENSNDLHVVARFNREAGLKKLEDAANITATEPVRYSIYAKQCSSQDAINKVREHLHSGVLQKLAGKQVAGFLNPTKQSDFTNHGYTCLILGACAMSLGCSTFLELSAKFGPGCIAVFKTYKAFMLGLYKVAPIDDEGIQQIHKALTEPDGFKSGVPYEWGSNTSTEFMQAKVDQGYTPAQATPCWVKYFGGRCMQDGYHPTIMPERPTSIGPSGREQAGYGDGCGGCDKSYATLACTRCKIQHYCSKECQKKDWEQRHKMCCRTPEDAKDMVLGNPKWMNVFDNAAADGPPPPPPACESAKKAAMEEMMKTFSRP